MHDEMDRIKYEFAKRLQKVMDLPDGIRVEASVENMVTAIRFVSDQGDYLAGASIDLSIRTAYLFGPCVNHDSVDVLAPGLVELGVEKAIWRDKTTGDYYEWKKD